MYVFLLLFASHSNCRIRNPAAILDNDVTLKTDSSAEDQAKREKEPGTLMTWQSRQQLACHGIRLLWHAVCTWGESDLCVWSVCDL